MRLNRILLRYSLIGTVLYSLLSGCDSRVTYIQTDTWNYNNNTDVSVKLEAYEGTVLMKSWTVEPGESLEQVYIHIGGSVKQEAIVEYDVARVVFGGTKELWCRVLELNTPYNIYNPENLTMTKIDERHLKYDFDISTAMMDAATEIAAARPPDEVIAGR